MEKIAIAGALLLLAALLFSALAPPLFGRRGRG